VFAIVRQVWVVEIFTSKFQNPRVNCNLIMAPMKRLGLKFDWHRQVLRKINIDCNIINILVKLFDRFPVVL